MLNISYVSFWLGLGILFSILFCSLATSGLVAVALRIFFSFFIGFASDLVADTLVPVKYPRAPEEIVANRSVAGAASLASPGSNGEGL